MIFLLTKDIYLPVKRDVLQSLKALLLLTSSSKRELLQALAKQHREQTAPRNKEATTTITLGFGSWGVFCAEKKPMEGDFVLLRLSCERSYRSYIYGHGVVVGSL